MVLVCTFYLGQRPKRYCCTHYILLNAKTEYNYKDYVANDYKLNRGLAHRRLINGRVDRYIRLKSLIDLRGWFKNHFSAIQCAY